MLVLRTLHAQIDELRTRFLQLSFCLGHIALSTQSTLQASLRELQRLGVSVDCRAKQLSLQIETAELKESYGQHSLKAQSRVGKVRCRCLRAGRARLNLPANPSPKVR